MNKFLIGAATLAMAVPALAQMQRTSPVARPMAPMAPMMQQAQTRDQMVAKVREHFAMMDANRDGFVAGDEMQSMRGDHMKKMGGMGGHGGAMGNPGAMFDRLDANRDGMISRDEFAKGREMRMDRKMAMGAKGDHGGMAGMHGKMGGGMGGRMMKMADLNQDGRVSLQEATTRALQHFDMVDTNRDGRITPEERRTMHQQRMEQKGRKAG